MNFEQTNSDDNPRLPGRGLFFLKKHVPQGPQGPQGYPCITRLDLNPRRNRTKHADQRFGRTHVGDDYMQGGGLRRSAPTHRP